MSQFVFIVCQCQTERLIKEWLQRHVPQARFAFSRPGLLTFKIVDQPIAAAGQIARCPFVRTYGWSWQTVSGGLEAVTQLIQERIPEVRPRHLHAWARDARRVGDRGFEPFTLEEWTGWGQAVVDHLTTDDSPLVVNQVASEGDAIIDLIQVESDRWLVGWHNASSVPSSWPGGVPRIAPREVVSRAYFKLEEAILWSRLPVTAGELAVELGAAPGGACQCLLDRGLRVVGVDPAEISPAVLEHPHFEHWRMRAAEIRKRQMTNVDWLVCDSNVAPQHTLDSVEAIVTNQHVQLKGLVLTLKMPDWRLADQLEGYMERVQGWGFQNVRARHLAFNRQEICVVAD